MIHTILWQNVLQYMNSKYLSVSNSNIKTPTDYALEKISPIFPQFVYAMTQQRQKNA